MRPGVFGRKLAATSATSIRDSARMSVTTDSTSGTM
jgi:hypothetical protein